MVEVRGQLTLKKCSDKRLRALGCPAAARAGDRSAVGDRLDCATPAAEKNGAQQAQVMRAVHARVGCMWSEGDGVESLSGNDPFPSFFENLAVGTPLGTVLSLRRTAQGIRLGRCWASVGFSQRWARDPPTVQDFIIRGWLA